MKRLLMVLVIGALATGCGLKSETPQEKQTGVQQSVQQAAENNYLTLAVALLKKGEVSPAIQALDEAIKQDRNNVQAYVLLGQTYMHTSQYDRAVDSFLAALAVNPDQGEIYYMLAIANGLRGRKDLAVNNAEKALLLFQQDRDGENFKKALVLLQGLSQQ